MARVFGALGMHPVGCYDLRDAARSAVPVISTAFRPVDADELAANPFRMFTSLLVGDDRRLFSAQLQARLDEFLRRRELFPPELIALSEWAATRRRGRSACRPPRRRDDELAGPRRDAGWLSDVMGQDVADPFDLYAAQQQASLDAALAAGGA